MTDPRAATEERPAMEVHLGETRCDDGEWVRHAIVWINGKRWEGTLREEPEADHRER